MEEAPGALASPCAVAVVVAATRAALAVERGDRVVPDVDWSAAPATQVAAAARLHRVTSVLVDRAEAIGLPDELRDLLRALAREQSLAGLRLAAESVRAVGALRAAGVPTLLFKGVALAVQSTGTPTARGSGDIDLLVRPADLPAAHEALIASGWSGDPLPPAGRWQRWYVAVRRERSYGGPAAAIDLHWRIGWHARPLPDSDTLLRRAGSVSIADLEISTLALPDALAAACYHAAVDRYARLRLLVDVARLLARPEAFPPADASWRLRRVMGETVALAVALLGPLAGADRIVPLDRIDVVPLLRQWEKASVRPEWLVDDLSLGEVARVYRDSARFAGAPAALAMAVTDGLMPPERIEAGMRPQDVVVAVAQEVGDLVRRRVLPRSGEPEDT